MELTDVKFMSGAEKRKVLKHWETFLKNGCKREHFTEALYDHLIQNCSFIAHYDRAGFYETYFVEGEDRAHFLSQFDIRNAEANGIPKSIEYCETWWVNGDYADINQAMIDVAAQYIPFLVLEAQAEQRDADVARAKALLAKHGIAI